jgi:hypothetical protein
MIADRTNFLRNGNLVAAIDDFGEEIARTRNNPKLMKVLEERARQTATIPLDEVKRRLDI